MIKFKVGKFYQSMSNQPPKHGIRVDWIKDGALKVTGFSSALRIEIEDGVEVVKKHYHPISIDSKAKVWLRADRDVK